MTHDVQSAIQAVIRASARHPETRPGRQATPVLAISRDAGSGGDAIARKLAERLGLPLYDREIIDRIAERLDADPETVAMLDENVGRSADMWLYRLLTGREVSEAAYRHHLINVILAIGREGGIIVGRGAQAILAGATALRVRITGTPAVCARRLAATRGIDAGAAEAEVAETNRHRADFVRDMFGAHTDDAASFDLVVNTDRLTDQEKVVDMLIEAFRAVGSRDERAQLGAP